VPLSPSINSVEIGGFDADLALSKCEFGNYPEELINAKDAFKGFAENRTRLHVISDDISGDIVGFVVLHLSHAAAKNNCLVIDFLFVSHSYRKKQCPEFGDQKISEFLLNYVIECAREVDSIVPVSFIALRPADDKLLPFYGAYNFELLDEFWMFLQIS
jgi:GNAT superfamily N-acetyltransferase